MRHIEKLIDELLNKEESLDYSSKTKDEIITQISVFHEELRYQNDELKRMNEELTSSKL